MMADFADNTHSLDDKAGSSIVSLLECLDQKLESKRFVLSQSRAWVQFLYAENLIAKAKQLSSEASKRALAIRVATKASQVLNALDTEEQAVLQKAKACLNELEEHSPDSSSDALQLFEGSKYLHLFRLHQKLSGSFTEQAFSVLISELNAQHATTSISDTQENALPTRTKRGSDLNNSAPALQSFKHYQSIFEKLALERLLNRVMQEIPENAGPLNPERLLIRSFQALQDISPEYLSQLLSYYGSLLTLQSISSADK